MDILNGFLDWLFYGIIGPLFGACGRVCTLIFIRPMSFLHFSVWLQVCLIAVLVAAFAFLLRRLLRVDEKTKSFNERFSEKRRQQQELQCITDKYSRDALYRTTDEELNDRYNSFLAHHYARYVMIYMLPIFLALAWLNQVFSEDFLVGKFGKPFVLAVPENSFGVQGFSVTFIFLFAYILSLIVGFRVRRCRSRHPKNGISGRIFPG